MARFILFLFIVVISAGGSFAQEYLDEFGFYKEDNRRLLPSHQYRMTFLKLEDNDKSIGLFSFRHSAGKPVKLSGSFDKSGAFHPSFVRCSILNDDKWYERSSSYCGTEDSRSELQPDTDYIFKISLDRFLDSGKSGLIRLSHGDFDLLSETLDCVALRKLAEQTK